MCAAAARAGVLHCHRHRRHYFYLQVRLMAPVATLTVPVHLLSSATKAVAVSWPEAATQDTWTMGGYVGVAGL